MKPELIDKVEIIDCSDLVDPSDDGQIVAVHSGGLTGWYGPVSAPVATLLDRCIAPLVIGLPISDHELLHRGLRRRLGTPAGALTSWAVGAVDCAVWDLDARLQERPVAALLRSGPSERAVPAYASWLRLEISDRTNLDAAARLADQGWRFTKWGLRRNPDLNVGDDAARLADAVRRVVETIGAPAAFDAVCTWDAPVSLCFAELSHHDQIVWLEEPLAAYDMTIYEKLAIVCPPMALGERLHLGDDCDSMLSLHGLRAFTIDVVGYGGLTAAKRATAAAADAGVLVYPHGRSLLPSVHLAAAFPATVAAVEYQLPWEPRRRRLFTDPIEVIDGDVVLPSVPGLGPVPRRR